MDRIQSNRFSFRRKGSKNKKDKENAAEAAMQEQLVYLSTKEVKELYGELVNEFAFSVDQLLELSGFSCAVAIAKTYPKECLPKGKGSILVCCGPGKNGATGLICARHLKLFGYKPTVFYPKPPPGAANALYHNLATQCEKTDIPFLLYLPSEAQLVTDSYSLIIDAIFGCGYQAPMATDFAAIVQTLIRSKVPIISLNVPSGWATVNEDAAGIPPPSVPSAVPSVPQTVIDVPSTTIQPEMLVSLLAPASCSRNFAGRHHWLGGRFLPSELVKKYDLGHLPPFPGLDVCVDLKAAAYANSDGEPIARSRKEAAVDDDFPPPPAATNSKEARGKTTNED